MFYCSNASRPPLRASSKNVFAAGVFLPPPPPAKQALNLILLTAAELEELRQALRLSTRSDASPEDRELFAALFACWCHNPVATFSLCLLAQAYEVSAELVKEVAEVEITVGFLMQVCIHT